MDQTKLSELSDAVKAAAAAETAAAGAHSSAEKSLQDMQGALSAAIAQSKKDAEPAIRLLHANHASALEKWNQAKDALKAARQALADHAAE